MAAVHVPYYIKLHEKQFFKLQTFLCRCHLLAVARVVYAPQRLVARDEAERRGDEGRQRLLYGGHTREERLRQPFHAARVQSRRLHLLRGEIVRLQAHLREDERIGGVDVRMRELVAAHIDGGFAEDDICRADDVGLAGILPAFEPH